EYNVKLSDFCLAKAGPTSDLNHVTTQVMEHKDPQPLNILLQVRV
nr:probable serine/threonine-protein kinase PBL3 [Tanacetum cinerariifolium]